MEHSINFPLLGCKNWASKYLEEKQAYYSWDTCLFPDFTSAVFNTESKNLDIAQPDEFSGRGQIKRFNTDSGKFVLRHFYRGGWVRHISKDLYMLPVSLKTRVEHEVELLLDLLDRNMAVPQPAAFCVQRVGPFCRMDIVLKEISSAQNLVEILCTRELEPTVWQNIGATLQGFHNAKICHADLNAHNILLDENSKVWLVDFDKSCNMKLWPRFWAKQNLARLKRSFQKELRRNANLFWNDKNWKLLLQGYGKK